VCRGAACALPLPMAQPAAKVSRFSATVAAMLAVIGLPFVFVFGLRLLRGIALILNLGDQTRFQWLNASSNWANSASAVVLYVFAIIAMIAILPCGGGGIRL
jgi:hypothetical protein